MTSRVKSEDVKPLRLISLHGDGSPHRVWSEAMPTEDPWTFVILPGTQVREASGESWSSDYPVVAMFWPGRYHQVFLLLKAEVAEYYCNVIAPPVYDWKEGAVRFTDLDLDVFVSPTGPRVLDEDEFAARSARYPREWVQEASQARDWLVSQSRLRSGPFSPGVEARWRRRLASFPPINPRVSGIDRSPTTSGPAP